LHISTYLLHQVFYHQHTTATNCPVMFFRAEYEQRYMFDIRQGFETTKKLRNMFSARLELFFKPHFSVFP